MRDPHRPSLCHLLSTLWLPNRHLYPKGPHGHGTNYQSSTLEKITGKLEKRLQRSADFSEWHGKILISTDLGQDCLEVDRGSVSHSNSCANGFHLETPQDKLIQLMIGRRSIEDLVIESDVSVSEDIIPALDPLFSLGHPHVWWFDRF